MNSVLTILKQNSIPKTDYIVVGCSGGPDSMCLLHVLFTNGYQVICAHVNHNIRKESLEEYKYVENYCVKNNIPFEGLTLEKGNKNEKYYRKKRYDFYKSVATKYHTKYIATAHHGDDLIETILMRITRGSNLKGYAGFSTRYDENGYTFIKPLIKLTKEEIIQYNEHNQIKYYIDKTNAEDKYTRNRYRHYVLPFLKKEDKNVHLKYIKFSEEIKMIEDYIENTVNDIIKENYQNNTLELNKFLKLDKYLQRRELQSILSKLYGDNIDRINDKHIMQILSQIDKNSNFKINLPCNFIVTKEYNKLRFSNQKSIKRYNNRLMQINELPNGYDINIIRESSDKSNYTTRLDLSNLKEPLYIRTRKDGDRMSIKNMEGTKKIKDIFIDKKVAPSLREEWPIIVDSNNIIVWLPGLKKSKFDNEKKYDIILEYKRKEEINEEQQN